MRHSHIKAHLAVIAFALAIPASGSAQAQPAPPESSPKLENDIKRVEWREAPASKNSHVSTDLAPRYAKWGVANAVVGAAEGWVLAYDMQQAQRRMGAARKAELRVFPDGRVLAYPGNPQVAKPAEVHLTPDELTALLDEVEKDPKTREHKFETPLGDLDAQSQQVALTGLLAASTPLGWDIAGDAVVVRRGNRIFVRSFDGLKEPLFERLHYHWIRRTLAGGTEGIAKALNFANEQLLARHPEAAKLTHDDFLSASFTAHPVDTRLVHFRRIGADGAYCQMTIYEPIGGTGYVLQDATFRPTGGVEEVWGQKHSGKQAPRR